MCALTYIPKISAKVIFPVCSSYFPCLLLLIITRELQRNQMKMAMAILFQTGEVQTYSLHRQGQPNQKTNIIITTKKLEHKLLLDHTLLKTK